MREAKHSQGEGAVLSHIGRAHQALGQPAKAIQYAEQAVAMLRTGLDRPARRVALSVLGAAYKSLGQCEKAVEYYKQALYLARDARDRQGEAEILSQMGGIDKSQSCPPSR